MILADAREGLYIRFAHHTDTRSGGGATPVFRLRPAISYIHDDEGRATASVEDGWERVVVIPRFPYARGSALPFTAANAAQFVECSAPKPTPRAKRNNTHGSRRSTR